MKHINLMFFVLCITLLATSQAHLLFPPFLPLGYRNQYFQQKLRISELASAEFSIQGLPKGVQFGKNGSIYGRPVQTGQFQVIISYISATQSGKYQTKWRVDSQYGTSIKEHNDRKSSLNIQFDGKLIYQAGKQFEISFKTSNSQNKVKWNFLSKPENVSSQSNSIVGLIQKQGYYFVHVQAIDAQNRTGQTCLTLNIQKSLSNLGNYAFNENNSQLKLLELKALTPKITSQLFKSAQKLGSKTAQMEYIQKQLDFANIRLIELEHEAKKLAQNIQILENIRKIEEDKVKGAFRTLQKSEQNFGFSLLQRNTNKKLLEETQKQVQNAEKTYQDTLQMLQSQRQRILSLQRTLLESSSLKLNSQQALKRMQITHQQIFKQLSQSKQSIQSVNSKLRVQEMQAVERKLALELKQSILNQQTSKYHALTKRYNFIENEIQSLQKRKLQEQYQLQEAIKQLVNLKKEVTLIKDSRIQAHQFLLKDNEKALQKILIDATQVYSNLDYHSQVFNKITSIEEFNGCESNLYPVFQGMGKLRQSNYLQKNFILQNGIKILVGNCSEYTNFQQGNLIFIKGYAKNGCIHASKLKLVQNF